MQDKSWFTNEHNVDDENLIKPGTPAWDYAVADGRGTKDALQWRQGDWANRICPTGKDGDKSGAYAHLERYAREVDVEFNTLRGYRTVANAFPPALRGAVSSFSIYKALQKYPHLIHNKPKTVREAMQMVKDEDARLAAEAKARAEEAARVAAEAKAREEAERERQEAEALRLKEESEARQREEFERQAREERVRMNAEFIEAQYQRGIADILDSLARIVLRFNGMANSLKDLPKSVSDDHRQAIESYLNEIENKRVMFGTLLNTPDMDAEIAKLLSEG